MPVLSILFSLAITLSIETGIYLILKHRDLKLLLVVSLMNLALNPTMNILLIYVIKGEVAYWVFLGLFEILTTLVESLIVYKFMRFKYLKILLFAFIANASSFLIGLALSPIHQTKIAIIVLTSLFALVYLVTYLTAFALSSYRSKDNRKSDSSADH